jgi:flagellar biosynthesis protein FlhF
MQIKRFEAKDIPEALRQVKEALGEDAIILSTRKIKNPSLRPNQPVGSKVEVVAASDLGAESLPFYPIQFKGPERAKEPPRPAASLEEDSFLKGMLARGMVPEFVDGLGKEIQALRQKPGWVRPPNFFQEFLRSRVMEMVDVFNPLITGAKIWAFIGPTGVGKTTTLAKLAAHFSLRMGKKITLVTIDTYRIGAVEQLRTYSRILGLPLEVPLSPQELKGLIEKSTGQDLLLIDTAGRNPNDTAMLQELRDFLTVHPHIENHLLLSATTKDRDLAQMVQRFRVLPIESYIITKIDETDEYVPILNQLLRFKRPLSYLTNGQRVPEDIELATKGRVANLILNQIQWN